MWYLPESSGIVHVKGKALLASALVGPGALSIDAGLAAVSLAPGSKLVLLEDEAFAAAASIRCNALALVATPGKRNIVSVLLLIIGKKGKCRKFS